MVLCCCFTSRVCTSPVLTNDRASSLGARIGAAGDHLDLLLHRLPAALGPLSYWAVTVGTNLVDYVPLVGKTLSGLLIGGDQIGQATLVRFYALHVAVLPILLGLLLMVHIWRVRKDGFAVKRGGVGAFAERRPRLRATSSCCHPRLTRLS
jgi:hypothetical protein